MKIAYVDCFAGASGDMILGALIDAGLNLNTLDSELKKLHFPEYTIKAGKGVKKGISGTRFEVTVHGDHGETPKHGHHHHHAHRNLEDIRKIIMSSELSDSIKNNSVTIFERLAEAEAGIHHKSVSDIHFHEVGAVDSIVDIVGAVTAFEILGIDEIYTSAFRIGSGTVDCEHGTIPVPSPATLALLKGRQIKSTGLDAELVTPTGAAILTTLSTGFGPMPDMQIESVGYGLGYRDLSIPNILRVVTGKKAPAAEYDCVQLIETNIDDMNPQFYDYIMGRLFHEGARDVFLTPIIMKKERPGVILSVIASPGIVDNLCEIILQETTTLGLRISDIQKRIVAEREIIPINTAWGPVRVKIRTLENGQKTIMPEYDDCKKAAGRNNIPIQQVYEKVKREAEKNFSGS